jgi:hypothetical protein
VDRDTGACRGEVRITLVYRPALDRSFDAEFVRVNVDAHLGQEDQACSRSGIQQAHLPGEATEGPFEHELIDHGLK